MSSGRRPTCREGSHATRGKTLPRNSLFVRPRYFKRVLPAPTTSTTGCSLMPRTEFECVPQAVSRSIRVCAMDPRTKKFPQITSSLETPLFGDKANFTAFAGYNGTTKKFDYRSFALTRILHDYEITFRYVDQPYGFRTEQGFSFTIRLKALPGASSSNTGQYARRSIREPARCFSVEKNNSFIAKKYVRFVPHAHSSR